VLFEASIKVLWSILKWSICGSVRRKWKSSEWIHARSHVRVLEERSRSRMTLRVTSASRGALATREKLGITWLRAVHGWTRERERPRGAVFNFAEAASAGNNKQGKQPSGGAQAGQARVYATRPARANKQVADQVEATPGARDPLMRSTSEQINGPSRPIFCQDGFLATLSARLSLRSVKTDFYPFSARHPLHRTDLPLIFQFKFCSWRIFITPLAPVQFFLRGSEWMIELENKMALLK